MAEQVTRRPVAGDPSARLARDVLRYVLAVAGYVAIGALTKGYMSFPWGLLYFVTVLDFVPRAYRRLRVAMLEPDQAPADEMVDP